MREFDAEDGRSWTARTDPGSTRGSELLTNVGWQAVLFEAVDSAADQRFVFRPAGWLGTASVDELRQALGEAEAIRATWGPIPRES